MKRLIPFLLISSLFGCAGEDDSPQPSLAKLPVVSIHTENAAAVDSRKDYIAGNIEVSSEDPGENLISNLEIRGRGNTTWQFPKKPYQIKLENKEEVLGMPEDRRWIFLANYSDKSMLRNELAFDLGRLSNVIAWTPESRFVELFLNNEYSGIYQITQKVEESSNRVDIGKDGFLLEVDKLKRLDAEDVYFETGSYLFNIKEPKVEFDDEDFEMIRNYIELTESVLLGDNFLDPTEGYTKYIDVASFVDWYLVNEITKNNDAIFFSSVYFNYTPGGKLKMGPIWDFDISLGNINYNGNETVDGFWVKNGTWFSRLFEDPNFIAEVKTRFDYFYSNLDLVREKIHTKASMMNHAIDENFAKWPILGVYVWPNYVYFSTYDEELEYMLEWFDRRMEWLKLSINNL